MKGSVAITHSKDVAVENLHQQYLASLTGSIILITSGMHFGWTAPLLPRLQQADSKIPITSSEGAWLVSMNGIGSVFGSLLGGWIVDRFGRKLSMLATSPLYLIAWLMIAFARSQEVLMGARAIDGFTDGIVFTALPMYLCEIAHPRIRGFLAASIPVMAIFGFLLINILGSYFDLTTTALISSIFPILHFCTFCWMPESPYFLIMRQKMSEAKHNLEVFQGSRDIDAKFDKLSSLVKEETKNCGKCWELFTIKSNRKALLIVLGMRGIQQFCGTNAITFYAKEIFHESGEDISSDLSSIIYFSVQCVATILCSFMVDKVGRKPLLVISIIGSGFALTLQGTYFYFKLYSNYDMSLVNFIPITALLGFVVLFNLGMWNIPLLMLGEMFPTNVRAFALCLNEIYFGFMIIIVSKFFQTMKDHFGMHVPFFAFAGFCALGLIFILTVVPETKGKSLEEIQQWLKRDEEQKRNVCNL